MSTVYCHPSSKCQLVRDGEASVCFACPCYVSCQQDGAEWTGVSLLYTVKEMDAGPVLAQKKVKVDPDIQVRACRCQGRMWAGRMKYQHCTFQRS